MGGNHLIWGCIFLNINVIIFNAAEKSFSNGNEIAIIKSDEIVILDVQTALDFMMSVNYETGSHTSALNKEAVTPNFFVLSTRIAGESL